jgi:hypothetical protein
VRVGVPTITCDPLKAPMKSKFAEQFEVTESPTLLVVDGGADATKEQARCVHDKCLCVA